MENRGEPRKPSLAAALNPFPDQLAISIRKLDAYPESLTLPAEVAAAQSWPLRRRTEFLTGRACAREVLSSLGYPEHALRRGLSGAPEWPAGVSGSIAHSQRFAVAVACNQALGQVGVDVEEAGSIEPALFPMICTPPELRRLQQAGPAEASEEAEAIFTLKEAFYKAQFALTGEWLEFQDVETCRRRGEWHVKSVKQGSASYEFPARSICRSLTRQDACWSLVILR